MFITTAEFLPQHRTQRQETLQLISDAQTRGHARLAEMNQRVLISLDQIIATFQDNPGEPTEDTNAGHITAPLIAATGSVDLRVFPARRAGRIVWRERCRDVYDAERCEFNNGEESRALR